MRKLLLACIACMLMLFTATAQNGLPENPEPGKCYIRCVTPDEWEDKVVRVMVKPAHKKLEVIPAQYKTEEVRIMVKPASKKYVYVPAQFKTVTEEIVTEERCSNTNLVQAKFASSTEEIEVSPAYSRYEYQVSLENCKSEDPRDCMVLCYVEHPSEKRMVPTQKVANYASFNKSPRQPVTTTITKQELVKEASVEEIDIPAEYRTIKKKVLASDEEVREIEVPAEYRDETTRVLVKKGGLAVWEEIDCELTNFTLLPVFYEYGSARLTRNSRSVIDDKILALMVAKPLVRVEINSHTDSRGSNDSNQDLSQRRAQSVVDYLISKGIDRDRLVARGYGESRLTNNCSDGADCTEEQHAKNRRTEFRVMGN